MKGLALPFLLFCIVGLGSAVEESESAEPAVGSARSIESSSSEVEATPIIDASNANEPVEADLQNDDFLLDPSLILARGTRDVGKDWSLEPVESGALKKDDTGDEWRTMDDARKTMGDDLTGAEARYAEEPEYWYRRENWRRRYEPPYPREPYRPPPPHRFFPIYPVFPGR